MFSRVRFITVLAMIAVVAGIVLGVGVTGAVAAVPDVIDFQGILKNSGGSPVPNGTYSVTFSIYDAPAGGAQLWTEMQSVTTSSGLFSVSLGSVNSLPVSVLSAPRYVQIEVSPDPPMPQRILLASSGFASVASRISGDISTFEDSEGTTLLLGDTSSVWFRVRKKPCPPNCVQESHSNVRNNNGIVVGVNQTVDSSGSKVAYIGGNGDTALSIQGYANGGRLTLYDSLGIPSINLDGGTGSVTGATLQFGIGNCAGGVGSHVAGDSGCASGPWSTIAGGFGNIAEDTGSTVGGGFRNVATTDTLWPSPAFADKSMPGDPFRPVATTCGGLQNRTTAPGASCGGGHHNETRGEDSRVGGGGNNKAGARGANVGGGNNNNAGGQNSTVSGGSKNSASGHYAAIPGGQNDTASADWASVGGGLHNKANGSYATIPGGVDNRASGNTASALGGWRNVASGSWSTAVGGFDNTASGQASFAAGRGASAVHDGSFVWADFTPATPIGSTGANQFIVRASGGMWLGTTNTASIPAGDFLNTSTGAHLTTGGAWTNSSDANCKENFSPVDQKDVLAKVSQLPIARWNYKTESDDVQHIGPTAQDFRALFGLGTDDKSISTIDPSGVALAAIQALNEKLNEQKSENDELRGQIAELREMIRAQATNQK